MRPSKLSLLLSTAILVSAFSAPNAFADHDPCKTLTAEKFGEIMGYKATINTAVSKGASCFYKGPGDGGGMVMIITEKASPQTAAMADKQGSTPQGENGKLGATFREGNIIFTVGVTGTDPAKVTALATEVKRNLK